MGQVLITGASMGIGKALADLFARDKHALILTARSSDKLAQLSSELGEKYGVDVSWIAQDLSEVDGARSLWEKLQAQKAEIDILVNNAGFGTYGFFNETPLKDTLAMLTLNITALTELTALVLPGMLAKGQGRILNVASTAAFQPGPYMAAYYASKAYVLNFSRALAVELKGTGIVVTTLCPGPTATNFQARAGMEKIPLLAGPLMMTAEDAAKAGYRGLMEGRESVIPGILNKISAFSGRYFPTRLVMKIVAWLQGSKRG